MAAMTRLRLWSARPSKVIPASPLLSCHLMFQWYLIVVGQVSMTEWKDPYLRLCNQSHSIQVSDWRSDMSIKKTPPQFLQINSNYLWRYFQIENQIMKLFAPFLSCENEFFMIENDQSELEPGHFGARTRGDSSGMAHKVTSSSSILYIQGMLHPHSPFTDKQS